MMLRNVVPFEERYEVTRELGSGHFAVVRQCLDRATGQAFAAKFIRKRRQKFSRRGAAVVDIDNEIGLLVSLKHEHIIRLYEVFEDDNHVILILELVSGGELFHYLSERDHLSEEDASKFVHQILHALDHLHKHNIAHLDLKPENILLSSSDSQIIKIIDFGLAKRLDQTSNEVKCMMGTAEFIAPEVVNYEALSLQTDMWSVGVITYMLLSGSSPFAGQDQQETFANITRAEFDFDEEVFSTTSDLAKDFISRLLVRDPKKRFTPRQAMEHPWIRPRNPQQAVKRKASAINMTRLKAFSAKRRWQKSLRVIKLCNRLSKGNRPASCASIISNDASSNDAWDVSDNFVTRAIFCAVEDGNRQGLERLLGMATVDLNTANELGVTAAHVAAGAGRLQILQLLKETYRLDILHADHFGDTPLHWAARQGQKETLAYILSSNPSANLVVNANKEYAIFQAVRYGYRHLFAPLLLNMDVVQINSLNSDGEGLLHIAAVYGSLECLRELFSTSKIDINQVNGQKETALHICASKGARPCVELLVTTGAEVNAQDTGGWVPLVVAMRNCHSDIVDVLLPKTRLTVIDLEGRTLLHRACEAGSEQVVQYLLENQPDILNRICNSGSTALHQAARYGHLEIVRRLCGAGIDVEALDADGLSSEVVAILAGHKPTGELLRSLGDPVVRTRFLNELHTRTGQLGCFTVRVLGHPRVGKTSFIKTLQNSTTSSFVRRGSAFFRRGKNGKKSPSKSPSMTTVQQMCHGYPLFSTTCVSLSAELDVAVFEMSSDPLCLQMYDHVIQYTHCLYIVMYNLQDSAAVQRQQVSFWLRLLSLSFLPEPPIGYCGKPANAPVVLLMGTHADTVKCAKTNHGLVTNPTSRTLVDNMRRHFGHELTILSDVFVVDNNAKNTGATLSCVKNAILSAGRLLRSQQTLSSALLRKIQGHLPSWRAAKLFFTVEKFTDLLQCDVNPLITGNDTSRLIKQLMFTGDILQTTYWNGADCTKYIIISPYHLFNQLIMPFLYGQLQLKNPRWQFRPRDLHFIFSNYWHDTVEVSEAMQILGLCVLSYGAFEFPVLADRTTPCVPSAGALSVRIQIPDFPSYPLLIFPRILTFVWSRTLSSQHFHAVKMTSRGFLLQNRSVVLRWSQDDAVEIVVGKDNQDHDFGATANLVKGLCAGVDAAIRSLIPAALLEYTVSVNGHPVPVAPLDDIKLCQLSQPLICRLCRLLDPKNCFGQDWCLLAVKLKLYDRLMPRLTLNTNTPAESSTSLLWKEMISVSPNATIQELIAGLEEIERADVVAVIRKSLPAYETLFNSMLDVRCSVNGVSPASPSEKTLSSMSSSLLSR